MGDANRFQFRSDADKRGVTGRPRGANGHRTLPV